MKLYLPPHYDRDVAPVRPEKLHDWYSEDNKTARHIEHCHPLSMATSLGWLILSPATFWVTWSGNWDHDALVQISDDAASHAEIDNHSAHGAFTIQSSFLARTEPFEWLYVKGVANERGMPYSCMEAAIETWWNPGIFGMVFLLNQPVTRLEIKKYQPIAQMFTLHRRMVDELELVDGWPPEYHRWEQRRNSLMPNRNNDYKRGRHPDGTEEPTHRKRWDHA